MTSSTQGISELRQRMIDDMRMRKLSEKTQSAYIRAVWQLAGFSSARRTRPAKRICGAISCIWSIMAARRSRSMRRSPG